MFCWGRNSFTDCIIVSGFGALGMVLGGIMEAKLRGALPRLNSPIDMIYRPIVFILFMIVVAVVLINIRILLVERRAKKVE